MLKHECLPIGHVGPTIEDLIPILLRMEPEDSPSLGVGKDLHFNSPSLRDILDRLTSRKSTCKTTNQTETAHGLNRGRILLSNHNHPIPRTNMVKSHHLSRLPILREKAPERLLRLLILGLAPPFEHPAPKDPDEPPTTPSKRTPTASRSVATPEATT
ncbi:hypothetical protein LIER_42413 [Lithospermum erythrorhizon]|uniref:Uncharacterized protein n=1 Tax=Lithospermum erythrorhizon TaxID=34254 RepID=A0AAV3RT75_LITER